MVSAPPNELTKRVSTSSKKARGACGPALCQCAEGAIFGPLNGRQAHGALGGLGGGFAGRALELADTGLFKDSEEVGVAMETDGVQLARCRLTVDANLRRMIDARCERARRGES